MNNKGTLNIESIESNELKKFEHKNIDQNNIKSPLINNTNQLNNINNNNTLRELNGNINNEINKNIDINEKGRKIYTNAIPITTAASVWSSGIDLEFIVNLLLFVLIFLISLYLFYKIILFLRKLLLKKPKNKVIINKSFIHYNKDSIVNL
jgi:hypothetical protein